MNVVAKSSTIKGTKKRVKLKDLRAAKKKLTGKDMRKVKGGSKWELSEYDAAKAPKPPIGIAGNEMTSGFKK